MRNIRVLVVEGPNINMLGIREPNVYGAKTMGDIHRMLEADARPLGISLAFFQSNTEGEIVARIQEAHGAADYIVINPAAYSHTSIAIRDALIAVDIPVIEVHLSNVYARESFRAHSYISDIAIGVISGFKDEGYRMALSYIARIGGAL